MCTYVDVAALSALNNWLHFVLNYELKDLYAHVCIGDPQVILR